MTANDVLTFQRAIVTTMMKQARESSQIVLPLCKQKGRGSGWVG